MWNDVFICLYTNKSLPAMVSAIGFCMYDMIFIELPHSSHSASSRNEGDYEQYNEDEEEDFSDRSSSFNDSEKPENTCDKCNNQKQYRPFQHEFSSFRLGIMERELFTSPPCVVVL